MLVVSSLFKRSPSLPFPDLPTASGASPHKAERMLYFQDVLTWKIPNMELPPLDLDFSGH